MLISRHYRTLFSKVPEWSMMEPWNLLRFKYANEIFVLKEKFITLSSFLSKNKLYIVCNYELKWKLQNYSIKIGIPHILISSTSIRPFLAPIQWREWPPFTKRAITSKRLELQGWGWSQSTGNWILHKIWSLKNI